MTRLWLSLADTGLDLLKEAGFTKTGIKKDSVAADLTSVVGKTGSGQGVVSILQSIVAEKGEEEKIEEEDHYVIMVLWGWNFGGSRGVCGVCACKGERERGRERERERESERERERETDRERESERERERETEK